MTRRDALDSPTLELIRFAAAIAQDGDTDLQERILALKQEGVPAEWVEELLLQSILMVGYPRALVALALWREAGASDGPTEDPDADYARVAEWVARGEETCARIYGANYRKLRENIRGLHPALDGWMITEGYGRTLARPGLDLRRRELCVVAQVALLEAPRQLHSHLRGALNVGAEPGEIDAVLSVVNSRLPYARWRRVKAVWQTVRDSWRAGS
jgi:4-carboxymuconolactone decarboxylase